MFGFDIDKLLQFSALMLSVVNGLILVRVHVRDRAKLELSPVHPDVYQWWFQLSPAKFQGKPTRVFGFLAYIAIANRGYRGVSIESWRLRVRSANWRRADLRPMSIPEPMFQMGNFTKIFPVLGQGGEITKGSTRVEPGCTTSGMILYVYECFGAEAWNPKIRNGEVRGRFSIRDVYGGKASCVVVFRERSLDDIKKIIPDVENLPLTASPRETEPAA